MFLTFGQRSACFQGKVLHYFIKELCNSHIYCLLFCFINEKSDFSPSTEIALFNQQKLKCDDKNT